MHKQHVSNELSDCGNGLLRESTDDAFAIGGKFRPVSARVVYSTSLPSTTHPNRPSNKRKLMEREAEESKDDFNESVQYECNVLASERYYWP